MERSDFEAFVSNIFGEKPDRPFEDDPTIAVFRHNDNRKWFGVVMTIPKKKLGIKDEGYIDIINLKCAEEIIDSLRGESGIYPAYHMNKRHWISVALDGSADLDTIEWLITISYQLTEKKKKLR